MAIVYQTNKKTGIRYVYESISYWDKDKKQSRAKRTCIGRIDPETGEVIPTRKRNMPGEGKRIKLRIPMKSAMYYDPSRPPIPEQPGHRL